LLVAELTELFTQLKIGPGIFGYAKEIASHLVE